MSNRRFRAPTADTTIDTIGMLLAGAFLLGCGVWWYGNASASQLPVPALHLPLVITGSFTCSLLLCWLWLALADLARGIPPLHRHRRRASIAAPAHLRTCAQHVRHEVDDTGNRNDQWRKTRAKTSLKTP